MLAPFCCRTLTFTSVVHRICSHFAPPFHCTLNSSHNFNNYWQPIFFAHGRYSELQTGCFEHHWPSTVRHVTRKCCTTTASRFRGNMVSVQCVHIMLWCGWMTGYHMYSVCNCWHHLFTVYMNYQTQAMNIGDSWNLYDRYSGIANWLSRKITALTFRQVTPLQKVLHNNSQ